MMRGSLAGLRRFLASLLCTIVHGYTQLSTMTDMAILTRARSAEVEAQVVEVEHLVARKVVEECTTASGRPAGLAPQCNRGRRQERGAIQPTVDNSKIFMVSFSTYPLIIC